MLPMNEPAQSGDDRQPLVWRSSDQAVIAAAIALGLLALAWWSWNRGAAEGRLVEIDRQPHRSPQFVLDINTAPWPEIAQLPGVGETLARRIVDSRQADGPFASVDELRRVNGLGAKTLDKIRPLLKVEGSLALDPAPAPLPTPRKENNEPATDFLTPEP